MTTPTYKGGPKDGETFKGTDVFPSGHFLHGTLPSLIRLPVDDSRDHHIYSFEGGDYHYLGVEEPE